MLLSRHQGTLLVFFLSSIIALCPFTFAYRPVQHCKHLGENGHYSGCVGLTQFKNASSGHFDLYLRYQWYRYRDSNKGWHAVAMGKEMAGAHMLIMYGDPQSSSGDMTVSVRTADGHHPPRPISEFSRFEPYFVPGVEIVTAKFETYNGPFVHEKLNLKPSHVGIAEVIIRSWGLWPGQALNDSSNNHEMLWSSNYEQDFSGDYHDAMRIEMHKFGIGFGFLWVDMENAVTPRPMFGPIDELVGMKGASEVQDPPPPTQEELDAGEAYIASTSAAQSTPIAEPNEEPGSAVSNEDLHDEGAAVPDQSASTPAVQEDDSIEQPAKGFLNKTLRDWMWHLHGLIMCFAFLVLYPLGVYLLRRPPPSSEGKGFNFHWTIQCLATICLMIGAIIGWVNSYGISVLHQYVGIFIVLLVPVQMFLGWRHHVQYMVTKQRAAFSQVHIWSGRSILPLGFLNIILGMLLRQYGWFTMTLVVIAMVAELSFLVFALRTTNNGRIDQAGSRSQGRGVTEAEAEEYFQLANDEEDEWSDHEQEAEGATQRREERRKNAERLARLDKV